MAFFSKKTVPSTDPEQPKGPPRDPKKARAWFERAKTVAESRQYDYAIECYISGLQFDPEPLDIHEALREVGIFRKANGGKPAGWSDKGPTAKGKTPVEQMLVDEYRFAMDPTNVEHGLGTMQHAVEAELYEVAYWVGKFVNEANRNSKKPSKQVYLKVRDLYAQMGAYDKAVETCASAVTLDPDNAELINELRNLQAETTMMKGQYGEEGKDFRDGIKDADQQRALEQQDAIAATGSVIDEQIARFRSEYEEDPADQQKLEKLIRALLQKEDKAHEDQAVGLLNEAWERTGQYRYKMQTGDVRMKQYNRAVREMRQRLQESPEDASLREQAVKLAASQLTFELNEFAERVKNYPTDMGLRYQLGRRQLALHQYDDAIASFQEAQADPKHRASALRYLGEAFAAKGWHDEAIDTFRRGIESYESESDRLALELRYNLMHSLETKGRKERDLALVQEAGKVASQIAQKDINFRDIRKRVESVRALIDELKQAAAG